MPSHINHIHLGDLQDNGACLGSFLLIHHSLPARTGHNQAWGKAEKNSTCISYSNNPLTRCCSFLMEKHTARWRSQWQWISIVCIWKYNSMEEVNNTTMMDIWLGGKIKNRNLTPGTLTLLYSSVKSLLGENDRNTAKRSAELKLLFSQGCMMAESFSSSTRFGVGFRGPPSTRGMDLFPTAVQTFIRRRAAWFLPKPTPLARGHSNPSQAPLSWPFQN